MFMRTRFLSILLALAVCMPALAHPGHGDEEVAHRHDGDSASMVRMTVNDGYRTIEANGLPNHATGRFPNRGNPNTIRAQAYRYRMPASPKPAERPTPCEHQPFGIALNGVVFDPATAEYWRNDRRLGWNYDALSGKINLGLDRNHAHVQPNGAYHYHGIPTGLVAALGGNERAMLLVGYAADGFPIYAPNAYRDADNPRSGLKKMRSSYRLKNGDRPGGPGGPGGRYDGTYVQDWNYVQGAGDLDECNGRYGVTPEYPDGTYYYVLTDEFPFIPRMFRGAPDSSFARRGGPGGRGGPPRFPPGRRPPPPRGGRPPFQP